MKRAKIFLLLLVLTAFSANAQMLKSEFVFASGEDMRYVIDIPDARFFNGAKLQVWEYYSLSNNQTFRIEKNGGFNVIRTAFNTDFALDVTDGSIFNGNIVQLWQCYPTNNIQRWIVENVYGSYFVIRSALDRNYVLAVKKPVANGSRLCIEKDTGANNQLWVILVKDESDSFYSIYKLGYDNSK